MAVNDLGLRLVTNRRGFLKRAGLAAGGATVLGAGRFETLFATSADCPGTTLDVLNAALTAEQLAQTFYFHGLRSSPVQLPNVHSSDHIHYFQAALWEEHRHAVLLVSVGATSLAGLNPVFFFPTGAFTDEGTFLAVLGALETAFIGAYTAAIGQWASPTSAAATSVPTGFTSGQLAKIAAQILGVEAEHRTLGRDVAGATVPNDRIVETAPFGCVGTANSSAGDGTAVGALLPFVIGGAGFDAGHLLPGESAIREAVTSSTISLLTNDIPGALAGP